MSEELEVLNLFFEKQVIKMTMIILESIKDLKAIRNKYAFYIKDCNVLLKLYRENITIIDFDNVIKASKTCKN